MDRLNKSHFLELGEWESNSDTVKKLLNVQVTMSGVDNMDVFQDSRMAAMVYEGHG